TRLTNDITQVQNTIHMSLRIAFRAPLLVIGAIAMALIVNWKLALILVVPIPLLIVLLVWMMSRSGKLFKQVQNKLDKVNNVMQENLIGMRLVKAFRRKEFEENRFNTANTNLRNETMKALRLVELVGPTLLFVMNIGILLIIWFGSFEVNQNGLLVEELVTLINYGGRITDALGMLTWITMAFAGGRASAQRISEVLNTEEDFENNNIPSTTSKIRYGKVDFENVSFTYPGTNTPVLQDISFTVEAGDRVAVMGATGSGKSTLFQLIPRLYDTTKGCIRIDGIDIRKMDLKTLRKQMGFVPQEAILFTGSVKENISWGKDDATMEEIIESMEDAQIYETIKRLPNTYETKIGQKGVNFSGGQKQRL